MVFCGSHFKPIILIILLSAVVYVNSFDNPFGYDTKPIIKDNIFIRHWGNFPTIFTSNYFEFFHELSYRPVVTLTYFIDYSIWRLNAYGYHLTNFFLHTLNAILIYLLVGLFLKDKIVSLLTASIFTLHPIQTEAVNAIAFRDDLLAALFFFLSFILFIKGIKYEKVKKICCFMGSIVAYFIALFSKEMAITLPILLVLSNFYFSFNTKTKNNFKKYYWGHIIATFLYLFIRFSLLYNIKEKTIGYPGGSLWTSVLTMCKVSVSYIRLLCLPINLSVEYNVHASSSFFEPQVFLSAAVIIILFVVAFWLYRYSKEISFSIFWFFITLLPVSNIVPIANIAAERYLYIPSISFCMILAMAWMKLMKLNIRSLSAGLYKKMILTFLVLSLIFYSISTIRRNTDWNDSIMLWTKAVKHSPDSSRAHNNLGISYARNGLFDTAIEELKKALELDPYHSKSYLNLGAVYAIRGCYEKAISIIKKLLIFNPNYALAHYDLGNIYLKRGFLDKAIDEHKRAIDLAPFNTKFYCNLGNIYYGIGSYKDAIEMYKEILVIDPNHVSAHYNLGIVYEKKGWYREAINELKEVLSLSPYNAGAYANLGHIYQKMGEYEDAIERYSKALKLNPKFLEVHSNLGKIYFKQKLFSQAREEWEKVLKIDPGFADAWENLEKLKGLGY